MSRFNELVGDLSLTLTREAVAAFRNIPVGQITSDPANPRQNFEMAELDGLAQSIRERGLLQPIIVRQTSDDRYVVRFGERRLRAVQIVGLETIPAIVSETGASENDVLDQLIENDQREALTPAEMAAGVGALLAKGLSKEDVAGRLGRPPSDVSMYVAFQSFPPQLSGSFLDNSSLRTAYNLFGAWKKWPKQVLAFVGENPMGITVAHAASFIRLLRNPDQVAEAVQTAAIGNDDAKPAADKDADAVQSDTEGGSKDTKFVWLKMMVSQQGAKVRLPAKVKVTFEDGRTVTMGAAEAMAAHSH